MGAGILIFLLINNAKGIYFWEESYVLSGGSRVRSKIATRVIESAGLKISFDWAEIRYPVAKAFVGSSPTPRTFCANPTHFLLVASYRTQRSYK